MMSAGLVVSAGSDSPVESMSPVLGMWAAMTRGGAMPEEALSTEEAVSTYTTNAYANGFDEPIRLKEGDPADLTLLDSDIAGLHPALFRKMGVLATVVGGSVVHSYGA
jgi:predicted amidohydrolase YtcJ